MANDKMKKKQFDVLFYCQRIGEESKLSHKDNETWSKSEVHCPRCAKKEVWREDGNGDYYIGQEYICVACKAVFYLPFGVVDADSNADKQRLAHLTDRPIGES